MKLFTISLSMNNGMTSGWLVRENHRRRDWNRSYWKGDRRFQDGGH